MNFFFFFNIQENTKELDNNYITLYHFLHVDVKSNSFSFNIVAH